MGTITIGIDLAKATFSTCTLAAAGRVVQRRDLDHEAFSQWLFTEVQSGNAWRTGELANGGNGTTTEDAFMPHAKGKDIMRPELTGSSLRNCWGQRRTFVHRHRRCPARVQCRAARERAKLLPREVGRHCCYP